MRSKNHQDSRSIARCCTLQLISHSHTRTHSSTWPAVENETEHISDTVLQLHSAPSAHPVAATAVCAQGLAKATHVFTHADSVCSPNGVTRTIRSELLSTVANVPAGAVSEVMGTTVGATTSIQNLAAAGSGEAAPDVWFVAQCPMLFHLLCKSLVSLNL
jgi:hypothetical protein